MREKERFDWILRGGRVMDSVLGLDAPMDIAVQDGKIAALEGHLPADRAEKTLDCRGLIVTPGLIDLHCHLAPALPITDDVLKAVDPDATMPRNGVTTAVDAGTAGWENFDGFLRSIIRRARTRVLAFVNIAARGMLALSGESEAKNLHPEAVARLAKKRRDVVVGIKTAHYRANGPFDAANPPWASVDASLEAGRLCGLPAMFDVVPLPQRSYPDLLRKMRPGDYHTHVFAGHIPLLNADGKIADYVHQARARGILFDLGHGAASFSFAQAQPAVRQGFLPDTLSSDLYDSSVNGPAIGLLYVLSKFLALGLPLGEVLRRVTENPAELLGRPELGTLAPGTPADIAVLRQEEGRFGFVDGAGMRREGDKNLRCALTMRDGAMLYNPDGLGL